MCGIAGSIQLDQSKSATRGLLDRMLTSIFHRGPDEDGRLIDRELAMGMRRLSIIDLADGKQPIFDESGRYGIVFNGEIYNYRELRKELESRGHQFKTNSDTEVIVHLFEERGAKCVDELRGMFAFAVWDNRERKLFIARDRMGIKPLYFSVIDNELVFASEIKAILQHPNYSPAMDLTSLSQFLSLKFVPAPRTLFKNIHSLQPGHSIDVGNGDISIKQYWDLSFEKSADARSEEQCVNELDEILKESIGLRLRSDVPFGAFLSGGIDSSLIVALMSQQMSEPVKTFTVGFDRGLGQDELPYARQVAEQFGCQHHEIQIDGQDFVNYAEDVLFHLDQPLADNATIATYMVAKLARKHVKMVLTGEGGDELFAGYARYSAERISPWMQMLPKMIRRGIDSNVARMPGMRREKIASFALAESDEATRFANWFPMLNDDLKSKLFTDRYADYRGGAADLYGEYLDSSDATDPIERMLYVDSKLWLPDYLLLRGDKLTMANSLEARVPLLDHKLVEFAGSLPLDMKLRGRTRKYLLKKCAEKYLPESIINRPKQGFPIPIDRWLKEDAGEMVNDCLSESTIRKRGFFKPNVVEKLLRQHANGFEDHATEIFGLLSLEMWMQKFIDQPTAQPQPCESLAEPMEIA